MFSNWIYHRISCEVECDKVYQVKSHHDTYVICVCLHGSVFWFLISIASCLLPQATPMSQMLCQNIEFQSGTLVYDLSSALTQLWQKRLSLQGSLFSCHRGRAAPYTLNDNSPWSNHQWERTLPDMTIKWELDLSLKSTQIEYSIYP